MRASSKFGLSSTKKPNTDKKKGVEFAAETEEQKLDIEITERIISELNSKGNKELYEELKRVYADFLHHEERKRRSSEDSG